MKYGVLVRLSGGSGALSSSDLRMGMLLYMLIPAHLFVGYLIEHAAATHARRAHALNKKTDNRDPKLRLAWGLISALHSINSTISMGVATGIVYYKISSPLIGTICQVHAST